MNKKNNIYTIRQTSRACGIGRTTLQRMESDGLITPYSKGENNYRYYDAKSISDINKVNLFHECGFSHRELQELMSDQENALPGFEKMLQDRINVLYFNLENIRAATRAEGPPECAFINIPDLNCYVKDEQGDYSEGSMYEVISGSIDELVSKGYVTNKYYTPFMMLDNPGLFKGEFSSGAANFRVCSPVTTETNGKDIITIPGGRALTFTFIYRKQDAKESFLYLLSELEREGLTPKGTPRVEALFNPLKALEGSDKRIILRLCIMC